jgi:mannose-1-phosphate guanylyltransferase
MEIDLGQLIAFHLQTGGVATMGVLQMSDKSRYGTVQVAPGGRVTGFIEKTNSGSSGFVNAGVYVFDKAILQSIPDGPASFEKDVFPKTLEKGVYALEQHGVFIDIGTPQDYERAQKLFNRLYEAAHSKQHSKSKQ